MYRDHLPLLGKYRHCLFNRALDNSKSGSANFDFGLCSLAICRDHNVN